MSMYRCNPLTSVPGSLAAKPSLLLGAKRRIGGSDERSCIHCFGVAVKMEIARSRGIVHGRRIWRKR